MRSSSTMSLLTGVLLVSCYFVSGCAVLFPDTSAKVGASLHAKPVVTALEKYRTDHLQYPESLTTLYPKYLATNVPITSSSWRIEYRILNPTNFQLKWNGGLSYAIYQTGTPVEYGSYLGH